MKHRVASARTRFVVPRPDAPVAFTGLLGLSQAPRAPWTRSAAVLVAGAAIFAGGPSAQAASATWSATPTNGDWEATAAENNWSTGLGTFPGSLTTDNTDVATFATSNVTTLTLTANLFLGGITFSSGSSSYTIGTTAGSSLELHNGGSFTFSASVAETINAPLVLLGNYSVVGGTNATTGFTLGGAISSGLTTGTSTLTLNYNSSTSTQNINGVISDGTAGGKMALILTGTSSVGSATYDILAGTNTYTGGTTVQQNGVADLHNASGFGTGTVALLNGSYIQETLTGAGLTLTTNNAFTLGTVGTASTINFTQATGAGGAGALNIGTGAVTLLANTTINFKKGLQFTIGGAIGDGGNNFSLSTAQTAAGGTLTLAGANTYTGATTIAASTALQIGNGGTTGSLLTSAITDNGTLSFNRSNANTFSQNIGGTGPVNIIGAGATTLNGANTYSGNTTINTGSSLIIGSSTFASPLVTMGSVAGGNINLTLASGGALTTNGTTASSPNITLSGATSSGALATVTFDAPTTATAGYTQGFGTLLLPQKSSLTVTQTANYSSPVTAAFGAVTLNNLNNGAGSTETLTANGGAAITLTTVTSGFLTSGNVDTLALAGTSAGNKITGAITTNASGGTVGIAKSGSGTWTFSNTSNYTGPTAISAGMLALGNGGNLGATAVGVTGTATLAVTPGVAGQTNVISSTSNLSLASGTSFTMADGVASKATVGGAATFSGAKFTFDLGAPTSSDSLAITGAVMETTGNTITLAGFGTTAPSGTYTLITAASGNVSTDFTLASTRVVVNGLAYTAALSGSATQENVTISGTGSAATAYYNAGAGGGSLNATNGSTTNFSFDAAGANNLAVLPSSSTDVYFTASNVTTSQALSLGQAFTINSLNFTSGSPAVTLTDASPNTLTINAGGITDLSANTQTLNVPLILGAAQSFSNTGTGTLAIGNTVANGGFLLTTAGSAPINLSAVISGIGGLTDSNTSTVALSGANTFTGGVTINAGTLQLGSTGALNSTAGSENAVAFGASSAGTLSLNGNSAVIANLNSNTTVGTPVVQNANATAATLTIGNSTNATGTFAGVIKDGTGGGALALKKAGTGTLTLSGTNTYSGGLSVASPTGAGTSTVNLLNNQNGATGTISVSNAGSANTYIAILNIGATNQTAPTGATVAAGNSILVGGVTSAPDSGVATLNVVGATGFATTLTDNGSLTVGRGGTMNIGNLSTVNESGALSTTDNGGFGATLAINAGGVLNYTGTTAIGLNSSGANAATLSQLVIAGGTLTTGQPINYNAGASTGQVTLSSGGTIALSQSISSLTTNTETGATNFLLSTGGGTINTSTFSTTLGTIVANVAGQNGSLTKSGAGTLALTAANTYTGGTTISAGSLQLGNGGTTGSLSTTGAIADAGNFTINRSNSVAQGTDFNAAAITGVGSFTQAGTGTTTLNAANTYSGGTNINAGILNVASAGALGTTGTISFNGGTLQYGAGITTDYSSRFSTAANQAYSVDVNGRTVTYGTGLAGTGTSSLNVSSTAAGGSLTLTGMSTYTGATTISSGTLQLGNGGTTGALSASSAITDNGTLAFDRSNALVQGTDFSTAAITGTGAVSQIGAGTTTLTAANTYTGATTIGSGTLQLGNGGTTGALSASSAITDNGTLAFDRSNALVQGSDFSAAAITGTGVVSQIGTGTTTLNAANTYTGGTNINAGVLNVSATNALGTTGTVSFGGGTLQYGAGITQDYSNRFNTAAGQLYSVDTNGQGVTYASPLTSSGGSLTVSDSVGSAGGTGGFLTLTNVNTYTGATTINPGATLNLGDTALTTDGSIANTSGVTNNGALVYNLSQSDRSPTYAISGVGSVTLNGSHTLTFATTNTYTGATTINPGATLALAGAGSNTGAASNSSGTYTAGTLQNTSSITVNNGGTLQLNANYAVNPNANVTAAGTGTVPTGTGAINLGSGVLIGQGANNTTGGTGVTIQGVGMLTLSNSSTLYYAGSSGTLVFSSFNPNGHTLDIEGNMNFASSTSMSGIDGTNDRLIFLTDPTTAGLADITFGGVADATDINLGTGNGFEIVPAAVPEPATWASGALTILAASGVFLRRRRARVV